MGSHVWMSRCPHCGFAKMLGSSYDSIYFEGECPICGYKIWTEETVPESYDVELAKRSLIEMTAEEKDRAIEQYYEDNIPLIVRLKKR